MKNVIDEDQKRLIEIESTKKQVSIEQAILAMNFMSNSTISKFLKEFRQEDLNPADFIVDVAIIKLVPYKFCINNNCLPISIVNNCLYIAMIQYDVNILENIKSFIVFERTQIIITNHDEIYELIQKNYANIENWIDFIEFSDKNSEVFIDRLLFDAVSKKASDIHFSPQESIVKVRYRIDGDLRRVCIFHKDYFSQICIRLKILFSVDITTSIQPRDGSLSKFIFGEKIDFRIAFHHVLYGENIVIRILSNNNYISLEKIGYSQNVLENITRMIHSQSGLVIFIGPTGSGKTTSLYSALKEIDPNTYNIMTVEDPVECNLPGVQQTDVNHHPDMTFSTCLRSILRQDPDVILIGEIRDAETASIALRASMTGHKVFTTLHAKDIFGVFDRLIELGLPQKLAINNVKGIVAQRLVKKICKECHGDGCGLCYYGGHNGRCVVAESIYFDEDVIDIFISNKNNDQKKLELGTKGYISLKEDVLQKIDQGLILRKQIMSVDWT
jgi:general secretion pathway protein E/type IV pilus assembly protein PilB